MFTSIYLHNYKTFTDTTINLASNNNKHKSLILLYGENGAGKSNFASVFLTFAELIRTMDVRDLLQEIIDNYKDAIKNEGILQMLKSKLRNIEVIIRDSKTIGSTDNMILEFNFVIKKKKGKYLIETSDNEIVHEKLEYTLEKNKGIYFDISTKSRRLNEKVFKNKNVLKEIQDNIDKFWGKHSLLAIINHEFIDKSNSYLSNAFSSHFVDCLEDFSMISCRIKKQDSPEYGILGVTHPILCELTSGRIKQENLPDLKRAENMLNNFLPKINTDIEKAYYKLDEKNGKIYYDLYTKQLIANEYKDIPFSLESTGTHNLIELLPFFILAAKGYTVIIDELDAGIHDLLVKYILQDIYPDIKGQLILTTHNTLIMNSEYLPASSFYVIQKDKTATRLVKCITDSEGRIHPNHNIQIRYIQGDFKAIPKKLNLSLKELEVILDTEAL